MRNLQVIFNYFEYDYKILFVLENLSFFSNENINDKKYKDFKEKREKGETPNYVCQLIRNDSIIDFIIYVNKTNLNLSSEIPYSTFETNKLILDNHVTLIEYAAF